jgi:hypothetical protein
VQGAITYVVQVAILSLGDKETSYWRIDRGLNYIEKTTADSRFAFTLAHAQAGRWRVWAVDAHGIAGQKSTWSTFEFPQ